MQLLLTIYLYNAQGQVMPQLATPSRLQNVCAKILVM
jgi:hypothetical protein